MPSTIDSAIVEKYRASVIMKDGTALNMRPILPEDRDKWQEFFNALSPQTVYFRFHRVLRQVSNEEAQRFCCVDYNDSFAMVATIGEGPEEKIIAIGRYTRTPNRDSAEAAFVVTDKYHGKGIGTLLLEQIAKVARDKGIRLFDAYVLMENHEMMGVFLDSGFKIDRKLEGGVIRLVLDIASTPFYEEKSAEREKFATINSLRAFLKPRSIAVVGASTKKGSIGHKLFHNILYQEFNGVVYPVHPTSPMVSSVKAYPSVLDLPGEVDLGVIVVPAAGVQQVVEQCGRQGMKGLVIISAGFGEVSAEGKEKEKKIVETARSYGMRVVGPNCMGILNTDPDVNLNATFSSVFPPVGNISLGTQSGALGLAILEYAKTLNIGLSTFVSIGNKVDVSPTDLLLYWEDDAATGVILLYLESFGEPRRFARTARGVANSKPIVAVKSGRTPAGSKAASSHTGALASSEVAAEALFTQAGIIRVDTLEELFDVANLLSSQPIPQGKRVAILTNGGGPGIMTADALAGRGLELPNLSENTVARLKEFLPSQSSYANPVDMTAGATAEQYGKALEIMAQDENVDSVIVIFVPPIVTLPEAVAKAIRDIAPEFRKIGKTLVASFMGSRGSPEALSSREHEYVPCFTFPESTAIALASAYKYGEWQKKPKGSIPTLEGVDKKRAEKVIAEALEKSPDSRVWLDFATIAKLFDCYGVRLVQSKPATTASEAVKKAEAMGLPVALKLLSSTITHKTEVGGVVLDLRTAAEVEQGFNLIKERLVKIGRAKEMQGVTVQQMATTGVEVIVGVTQDPSFGPLIMFGLGGTQAELFKDVSFRIHPLTDLDAAEMVRSVKAYQLLKGWRGAKPSDIKSVEDLLLRISDMVEDIPQLVEVDLNPVKVLEENKGYVVVDARVLLAKAC
jgi:acetyl coenzyme A synthetase (ADP forming)-like protein